MSKHPKKIDFWRQRGFNVEEKRGWVRKIGSQARECLSPQEYIEYMKKVGWESII